jgi:hypothetical protein
MKTLFVALLLAITPMAQAGEYINGEDLYVMLQSDKIEDKANAVGYIIGAFDGSYGYFHCSPTPHPARLVDTVHNVLKDMPPETRKKIPAAIFVKELMKRYGKRCEFI